MKAFLWISATAILMSCGSGGTQPDNGTHAACMLSTSGTNQLCSTMNGRTDLTNAACDSLANNLDVKAYFPQATMQALESCPTAMKECDFSYTDTTTNTIYAGRGYFYETTTVQGSFFCASYGSGVTP